MPSSSYGQIPSSGIEKKVKGVLVQKHGKVSRVKRIWPTSTLNYYNVLPSLILFIARGQGRGRAAPTLTAGMPLWKL